jgi:hypothetical protein
VHWEATHVTLSACPGSCWDLGLFVSGAVPALFFGVAVGNVLQGVPFRFDDTFADDLRAGDLELQLKQIGDARRRFGVRANAERRNSGAREPHSNSVVFREAILRLENHDARKLGQGGFYPLPDPDRDIFRRGVFEPIDIVQITMVEPFEQRFEGGLDREEIGDKAGGGIDRALKPQFHAIGMPV